MIERHPISLAQFGLAIVGAVAIGCGSGAAPTDAAVDSGAADDGGAPGPPDLASSGPCPAQMALVAVADGGVCVDRWEGALVEIGPGGAETPYPHYQTVGTRTVRAIPAENVKPQGYISQVQAQAACMRSGKRLCTLPEWMAACEGPNKTVYPYGNTYVKGACNEGRATNPVNDCFGSGNVFTSANMNDPCCDMQPNGVAPGGQFAMCVSSWGVFDLHGNRHEWIDATQANGNGVFKGGYFVDATLNFPGCGYRTLAHAKTYHDYSTGFRCCSDPK
jgi:formylglycine-generating enzyme